jgi:ATP synthase protein I
VTREGETSSNGTAGSGSGDPDFDRRLDALRDRLAAADPSHDETDDASGRRGYAASLAGAMRLSSEFIAGIVGGGGIGWLIDHFLGTSPWGLIVFVLIGFVGGVYSVMRDSGFLDTPPGGQPGGGK